MKKTTNRGFKKIAASVIAIIMIMTMALGITASAATSVTSVQAKQIALNHAGLTESKVTGLYANTDYDNGVLHYEVEFYCNGVEYDYDIKASDGSIISYEHDGKNGGTANNNTSDTLISKDAALAKALAHAKLSASDVRVIKNRLELDDGIYEYQVEFTYNGREYDYEINASTGAVISYDVENVQMFDGIFSFLSLKLAELRTLIANFLGL